MAEMETFKTDRGKHRMSKQSEKSQQSVSLSKDESVQGASSRLSVDLYAGALSYRLRELRGVLMGKGVSLDYYSKADFLDFCLRELSPEKEADKLLASAIISLTMTGSDSEGKELLCALELVEEKYFEMMIGILASQKMKPERIKKWLSVNIDFFQKSKPIEYSN